MKFKINIYTIFPCILSFLLYIGCFFSVGMLNYVDEIIALWAIIYIVYMVINIRLDSLAKSTTVFLVIVCTIGFLSNIIFQYQKSWLSVFVDMFTFIKPFVTFLAFYIMCNKERNNWSLRLFFRELSKILTVIIFVSLIIGLVFDIPSIAYYDSWSDFKFLKSFVFFTGYPGQLAVLISSLILVQLAEYEISMFKYIIMNVVSVFFTQSGVGFISIFLLIVFGFIRRTKKIRWYHVVPLVIGGVIVGANEIYYYLLTSTAARSVLLKYSFITAKRFFPWGAGFANFGSSVAASDYARLYSEYSFGKYWGMSQGGEYDFLHDSYYPIIVGEFGFVGAFFYILYLIKQFNFINNIKDDKNLRYALIFSFVLILVMNLGQGSFSGNIGSIYMVLWGVYFNKTILNQGEVK